MKKDKKIASNSEVLHTMEEKAYFVEQKARNKAEVLNNYAHAQKGNPCCIKQHSFSKN
ncbi:MAG: hypothetical protein ACYDCN_02140 [Bacteroidia bacterium]